MTWVAGCEGENGAWLSKHFDHYFTTLLARWRHDSVGRRPD